MPVGYRSHEAIHLESRRESHELLPRAAETTQHALESAASFVRRHLAQSLPLRRIPALRFRYDPSLALGDQTLSLLRSLADQDDT